MTASVPSSNAQRFFLFIGLLTAIRIVVLVIAAPELGPDETQYWFWSKTPDVGYYSKPPLIAWAIGLTTALFGNAEWAVRLSAPLFHFGSASFVFLAARQLYDERMGLWAGATWALIPGVSLSSTLIATDAPLMLFWSMGLYFFLRLINKAKASPTLADGIGLGAALGLGFLSKYAMVYFPLAALLILFFAPHTRQKILSLAGLCAVLLAVLIVSPNILWNARHDFQTLSHTADNANWGANLAHPFELLEFWGAQFGVAGPLLLCIIIAAIAQSWREEKARILIAFIVPAILAVSVQAFLSRAHANWAAAAYPAAVILAVAWAIDAGRSRLLLVSNALHSIAIAILFAIVVSPGVANTLGLGGAFKALRGWENHGEALKAHSDDYSVIMADEREILGGLLYYGERAGIKANYVAWNSNNRIDHHYEAFMPYDPAAADPVLYVTLNADALALHGRFNRIRKIGQSTSDLGGGRQRVLYFFEAEGFRG